MSTKTKPAVDEVFAIRVCDLLRLAADEPTIGAGLRLAFRRAAQVLEDEIANEQKARAA